MDHTASHQAPRQGVRRARLELEGDERRLFPLRYRFKADLDQYYKSFPERAGQHDNEFQELIDMVVSEEAAGRTDEQRLIKAYNFVTYRLHIMEMATDYVDRLNIGRPMGESCEEFSYDRFLDQYLGTGLRGPSKDYWYGREEYLEWAYSETRLEGEGCPDRLGPHYKLFPKIKSTGLQELVGRKYEKGDNYMCAAIALTNVPLEEVKARIKKLYSVVDWESLFSKTIAGYDEAVEAQRQKRIIKRQEYFRQLSERESQARSQRSVIDEQKNMGRASQVTTPVAPIMLRLKGPQMINRTDPFFDD